jgi:hypothetical protein
MKGVNQVATANFSFKWCTFFKRLCIQNARIQGLNMAVDFGMMEMMNIKLLEGISILNTLQTPLIIMVK